MDHTWLRHDLMTLWTQCHDSLVCMKWITLYVLYQISLPLCFHNNCSMYVVFTIATYIYIHVLRSAIKHYLYHKRLALASLISGLSVSNSDAFVYMYFTLEPYPRNIPLPFLFYSEGVLIPDLIFVKNFNNDLIRCNVFSSFFFFFRLFFYISLSY